MNEAPKGKIGRLPRALQEQFNRRLGALPDPIAATPNDKQPVSATFPTSKPVKVSQTRATERVARRAGQQIKAETIAGEPVAEYAADENTFAESSPVKPGQTTLTAGRRVPAVTATATFTKPSRAENPSPPAAQTEQCPPTCGMWSGAP